MEITGIIFIDLIIALVAGLVVPIALLIGIIRLARKFPRASKRTGYLLTPILDFCAIAIAIVVGLAVLLVIGNLLVGWIGWIGLGVASLLFLIFLWLDQRRIKQKKEFESESD